MKMNKSNNSVDNSVSNVSNVQKTVGNQIKNVGKPVNTGYTGILKLLIT